MHPHDRHMTYHQLLQAENVLAQVVERLRVNDDIQRAARLRELQAEIAEIRDEKNAKK